MKKNLIDMLVAFGIDYDVWDGMVAIYDRDTIETAAVRLYCEMCGLPLLIK